jgi:hypothetical protein
MRFKMLSGLKLFDCLQNNSSRKIICETRGSLNVKNEAPQDEHKKFKTKNFKFISATIENSNLI